MLAFGIQSLIIILSLIIQQLGSIIATQKNFFGQGKLLKGNDATVTDMRSCEN